MKSGEIIDGRYVLLESIGQGATSIVFAATDRERDREVAIKLLAAHAPDALPVERFLREARLAGAIEHPGVVRIHDSGTSGGLPFVVMERLHGCDLASFIRSRAPLSLELALGIGVQIADALYGAHRAGVIHRDLKPANIFVESPESSSPHVKILDFGLAAEDGRRSELTGSGQILGSLPYMAPELLNGAAAASVTSDLYAATCVIYELLFERTPFPAVSRFDLMLAIQNDSVLVPPRYGSDVHAALVRLFERGLAKRPGERHRNAGALGDALRALSPSFGGGVRAAEKESGSGVPNRFRVLRVLGEGAHGEVLAVHDRVSGRELALKRLRSVTPEALSRLKREFRTLTDLRHESLVRFDELWVEGDTACFTMELVDGQSLARVFPEMRERALELVRDLARGLAALHAHALVHRDLKPSNILIDSSGRTRIVDFGSTILCGERALLEGTPRYVAPEVLDGVLGTPADIYSLGVILFELLAGPSAGSAQSGVAGLSLEALRTLAPTAPEALATLCRDLLKLDAAERPSALEILERLDALHPARSERQGMSSVSPPFVGRSEELRALEAALTEAATEPVILEVHGPAGIGKTTLLEQFARAQRRRPGTLVLESRCHRSENLPLPALDAAIEALAHALQALSPGGLSLVTPRRVRTLCKLLPAFAQVPWPNWADARDALPEDPSEQRNRGVDSFAELLLRLSDSHAVVLTLDDAQWIDEDSLHILRRVLGGADPPRLLLVLAIRDDPTDTTRPDPFLGLSIARRRIDLVGLPDDEGRSLVEKLLPGSNTPSERLAEIVRAANGNPYFLSLLLDHAQDPESTSLSRALLARERALSPGERSVLETVALSYRPLPARIVLGAAECPDPGILRELESARLIRVSPHARGETVEPYHALVAETIARMLPDEARERRHRALARALGREPGTEDLALVAHTAASGDFAEAARIAVRAASNADGQLAFERAAALYRVALRHAPPQAVGRLDLEVRLAEALRNAGRAQEAGEVLLAASQAASANDARALRRRAGELFLLSGNLERGLSVITDALERVGLAMPAPAEALGEALRAFQELLMRGLDYEPRAEQECPLEALERVDLCLSLAQSLHSVDLRSLGFLLRGLLHALAVGEKSRLQRALALFVAGTASHLSSPLIAPALAICRELAGELGGVEAAVLLGIAEAEHAHFQGDFLEAEAHCERTERTILESCVGATRELADVRSRALLIQYSQKGDYRSIFPRSSRWLEEAVSRGDRFHANWLRAAHALVWVARDRPDIARAELERAEADWPGGAGVFEVAVVLYHDVIDRYTGADDAHLRPAQGRASVLQSPASQTPFLQGYLWLHRAWGALRCLHRTGEERGLAERAISALRQVAFPLWPACANALEANLSFLDGRRETAISLLEESERALRRINVLALAACARKRRGELMAGTLGKRIEDEADAQLSDLGIVAPRKFVGAYWAPFPIGETSADAPTLVGD